MSPLLQTVLLDTDYAIDFLRGVPKTKNIVVSLWEKNTAFLSLLSVYELYASMHPSEKKPTEDFINACRIEPLTMEIAKKAGEYRYKYQRQGITLSVVDCLIAKTAQVNSHQIATNNKKHYPDSSFLR